jgi:hypothetical protein
MTEIPRIEFGISTASKWYSCTAQLRILPTYCESHPYPFCTVESINSLTPIRPQAPCRHAQLLIGSRQKGTPSPNLEHPDTFSGALAFSPRMVSIFDGGHNALERSGLRVALALTRASLCQRVAPRLISRCIPSLAVPLSFSTPHSFIILTASFPQRHDCDVVKRIRFGFIVPCIITLTRALRSIPCSAPVASRQYAHCKVQLDFCTYKHHHPRIHL